MTKLFGRKCRVVVGTFDLTGLRITFSVTRTLKPEPNVASVSIYNLSESTRGSIDALESYIPCEIEAGYEENFGTLFIGGLRTVSTKAEGPDLVTTIETGDKEKAFRNARVNVSIPAGAPIKDAVQILVDSMKLDEGNIGTAVFRFNGGTATFAKGTVLSGSASRALEDICNSCNVEWSVQNGALQVLGRAAALETTAVELTPDTGLIDRPSLRVDSKTGKQLVTASAALMPDIVPGRQVVISSRFVSGNYRVTNCVYNGDTHGNDWQVDFEGEAI